MIFTKENRNVSVELKVTRLQEMLSQISVHAIISPLVYYNVMYI